VGRALIVVDVQKDFCPGGSLPVDRGDKIAGDITAYMDEWHDQYQNIICTKDWHPDDPYFGHFSSSPDYKDTWPAHCIAGTDGAMFHPNFDTYYVDAIFHKGQNDAAYSGFEGTNVMTGIGLDNYIRLWDITELHIVGLALDYCVKATAIDAAQYGYDTTILVDLTAPVSQDVTLVMNELDAAGVAVN
jgi:nicotinamidase/pyrazinamidase